MSNRVVKWLFTYRDFLVLSFALITGALFFSALQMQIGASFESQIPLNHSYIQTFLKYRDDFGGANRLLISVSAEEGDIFTPEFFQTLKQVTEESYFIDGVNRSQIRSLFTPNVRYVEIVEGGFSGGNVVPADFDFSQQAINGVRENILKSTIIGRLVSNDFTSAMVSLQLSDISPVTGETVDYIQVAELIESNIRERYESDGISIQIIGFAKAVGDIAAGARGVLIFIALSFFLTAALINLFLASWRLTALAVACSASAVIWNIGIVTALGYSFDPLSVLNPALIMAIGLSHAMQILNRVNNGIHEGMGTYDSTLRSLSQLFLPGIVALLSDTIGFLTIYLIDVETVQQLALKSSLGVLSLIATNLVMLPVFVSYLNFGEKHRLRLERSLKLKGIIWRSLSHFIEKRVAITSLSLSAIILALGFYYSQNLQIGDVGTGLPALKEEHRYNRDSEFITDKYSIGVDIFTVILETLPDSCIQHYVMDYIDEFAWTIENNPHVQSTLTMAEVMKRINAGWMEGHPKWQALPRNSTSLVQSASSIETSTGLRNSDCSVIPMLIFMKDHRAESIHSVIHDIERFEKEHPHSLVKPRLASGNVGVMAAQNDLVASSQYSIIAWIYSAVCILCLLLFRSLRATLCVMIPLITVSTVAYGVMAVMGIGLIMPSLSVAALGVGIGVDYGIYIFSQLLKRLRLGENLYEAYTHTLQVNGTAVLVTGLTLTISVFTWVFSDLKFQQEMGILFATLLILNMFGALFILPSLVYFFFPEHR